MRALSWQELRSAILLVATATTTGQTSEEWRFSLHSAMDMPLSSDYTEFATPVAEQAIREFAEQLYEGYPFTVEFRSVNIAFGGATAVLRHTQS